MAVDELEAINDAASDEDKASEATMEEVEKSYAELQSYYESQPEYFGIAVPYFTSKDAKEGPISALLSVADIPRAAIGVEGGVTIDQVQQLVDGFKQALPGLVQVHGDELLAARKQALSHIKDGMTTAEKLLVLNDWLGNYSNFDMADIMKNQKKDSSSEDTSKQAVEAKVQKAAADYINQQHLELLQIENLYVCHIQQLITILCSAHSQKFTKTLMEHGRQKMKLTVN